MEIKRGDTKEFEVEITDSTGQPVDITGKTVWLTIRLASDTPPTSLKNDDNAVISKPQTKHTDPTRGLTIITLTSIDTDIDPGEYHFDCQYSDGAGTPIIWSSDVMPLTVVADITRSR